MYGAGQYGQLIYAGVPGNTGFANLCLSATFVQHLFSTEEQHFSTNVIQHYFTSVFQHYTATMVKC